MILLREKKQLRVCVETILQKITRQGCNLSIVKNTDGFLSRVDTQQIFIKEAGITLVLEPISGGYFRDSAEPFAILDEVGSPNVKLLYDIFHYQIMEGNIVETIRANIDKIGHFHAACVPGRNEITKGELDYRFIFREIEKAGYKGYVGMEYLPVMDKEESVRDFMNLMENL